MLVNLESSMHIIFTLYENHNNFVNLCKYYQAYSHKVAYKIPRCTFGKTGFNKLIF